MSKLTPKQQLEKNVSDLGTLVSEMGGYEQFSRALASLMYREHKGLKMLNKEVASRMRMVGIHAKWLQDTCYAQRKERQAFDAGEYWGGCCDEEFPSYSYPFIGGDE